MFKGRSFCFVLLDHVWDPSPGQLADRVKFVARQGGKVIELPREKGDRKVTYVVVGSGCEVKEVKEKVRGKFFYQSIVDFRWIQECQKRFQEIDIFQFNL